jgi:hypothetical protein
MLSSNLKSQPQFPTAAQTSVPSSCGPQFPTAAQTTKLDFQQLLQPQFPTNLNSHQLRSSNLNSHQLRSSSLNSQQLRETGAGLVAKSKEADLEY